MDIESPTAVSAARFRNTLPDKLGGESFRALYIMNEESAAVSFVSETANFAHPPSFSLALGF